MNSETEKKDSDDKISLIDIFAVLWRRKKMIIVITLTAAIGVVLYSVTSLTLPPEKSHMPNIYTSTALMLIDNKSSSGGLSSTLGSIGGLSSLFGGISTSASSSELAMFLVGSNSFLDSVVDNFNLIEKYNIKKNPRTSSRGMLSSLKAGYSSLSGVLSISFTHIDPVFARDVVNYSSAYLGQRFDELGLNKNKIEKENLEINIANTFQEIQKLEEESRKLEQSVTSGLPYGGGLPVITMDISRIDLELNAQRQVYTQLVVQYELLKVSMASETPVFQILEMAEIPELKSGPNRVTTCIIFIFAAGFLSVFLAFALNAISYIKNDPQAMAKLRRINEK